MKLTREATTAANPDLRGRKHHFIIESATAAELEGGVSGNPRKFRHSALWNFLGGWSAA
ncbi:TPA: hypothetical protein ACTYUA_004718 [Enterobacter hormaechei]